MKNVINSFNKVCAKAMDEFNNSVARVEENKVKYPSLTERTGNDGLYKAERSAINMIHGAWLALVYAMDVSNYDEYMNIVDELNKIQDEYNNKIEEVLAQHLS